MTNYEKIKNMSPEEMATRISQGISSDPCDYCSYNFDEDCGMRCDGHSDFNIILEWLYSEVKD